MRTTFLWEIEMGVGFQERFRKDLFHENLGGFPKVMDEGGVTAKIYKSVIKNKYDLFTLAYYMDGQFKKENFGSVDDAIARGKQVIRQLKGGEFDGVVMTSQQVKAFFASLKNLESTRLSLESSTKEIAACYGVLQGAVIEIKKGKAKTRSRRLVPITPNLALFLKGVEERNGPVWAQSEPFLFDLMRDAGQDNQVGLSSAARSVMEVEPTLRAPSSYCEQGRAKEAPSRGLRAANVERAQLAWAGRCAWDGLRGLPISC